MIIWLLLVRRDTVSILQIRGEMPAEHCRLGAVCDTCVSACIWMAIAELNQCVSSLFMFTCSPFALAAIQCCVRSAHQCTYEQVTKSWGCWRYCECPVNMGRRCQRILLFTLVSVQNNVTKSSNTMIHQGSGVCGAWCLALGSCGQTHSHTQYTWHAQMMCHTTT
jgi:hypothetical protein